MSVCVSVRLVSTATGSRSVTSRLTDDSKSGTVLRMFPVISGRLVGVVSIFCRFCCYVMNDKFCGVFSHTEDDTVTYWCFAKLLSFLVFV